jgi:hypothetical protein
MNLEFDRWVWRFSEELSLDQTDTDHVRTLLDEFERAVRERIINLIGRLDLPDPDPHSWEGEWEALIAGKEAARDAILQVLKGEGDV